MNELTTRSLGLHRRAVHRGRSHLQPKPLSLSTRVRQHAEPGGSVTGGWGESCWILNSSMTTTLATLDTLGSLITYSATLANDQWKTRFYQAATPFGRTTPRNTLEAMAGIARAPWAAPKELYTLFDRPIRCRRRMACAAVRPSLRIVWSRRTSASLCSGSSLFAVAGRLGSMAGK
ncbi:MAG: hypothetical protein U1G08_14570 [Verrucomicrobiota bacterium]